MRVLLLALTVSLSLAQHCPEQCSCGTADELEFYCQAGAANIVYNARNNEYVNIKCQGTNFTCADLPVYNFANNMSLSSLMIRYCPPSILECLPEALQMTSVANYLNVWDGKTPLTGEHVAGMGDVTHLMIKRGPEKTIPISAILALPSLKNLRISSTKITLESYVFSNVTQLEFLELSEGDIKEIPEDAFNGLKNLEILNMWGNNIQEIGVNAFRGLDSLKSLSLTTCNISSMSPGSLAHAPQLESVEFFMNRIQELPPGLMYNLTKLENITIQTNEVPLKLHKHSFANLPSLKNLIITDSATNLPAELFTGCDGLITINFARNKITSLPEAIFKDLKHLETLDLSYNQIATLSSKVFTPLKKLKYLNLNRNYLEALPDFLFSGLTNLNYVSMDDNFLTFISSTAFQGAVQLKTISMKNNRLTLESTVESEGYSNFDEYSPFSVLTELKNLYLNGNEIKKIFSDWNLVFTKLKELNLSGNNFTFLDASDCQFLSNHLVVDLRNNSITSVMMKYATFTPQNTTESTNSVLLDDNPLECDCGLYNLAMRVRGAKPMHVEPRFDVGNSKCASPKHLKDELFVKVSPSDLVCELPPEECNNSCYSCELRPATNDLAYNCKSVPLSMENPQQFGLQYLSLRLKIPPTTLDNLNLRLLNLSGIGLKHIPFSPSKSVEAIDFSNNNLTSIPTEFLTSNITLYLSNNNFICDCWNSKELALLKESLTVKDLAFIKCGDKFLTNIDPFELCNNWRAAAVASGTFIILIVIVAIIATVIYKNSHEILVFIINHGLCPCCFVDDLDDIDKEYDVFVSYAHKDREYLKKIMPKLENEFGLKTCVHYRDWYVGDFIPDQINRSVEKSRKTVLLLSNNFLDSAYANMEFRAAHNLALKEGKNRIILILLEDVTKHEKLSDELKAHMKMNTYLKWNDANFYEKLHQAMPLIKNKKFVWPSVIKQANEKSFKSGLDVYLNSDGQLVNVAAKDVV